MFASSIFAHLFDIKAKYNYFLNKIHLERAESKGYIDAMHTQINLIALGPTFEKGRNMNTNSVFKVLVTVLCLSFGQMSAIWAGAGSSNGGGVSVSKSRAVFSDLAKEATEVVYDPVED